MNFFDQSCQEPVITDPLFGICDGRNGAKAFTDHEKPETWIATVRNDGKLGLTFTIMFFLDNHDASAFKHKKAFACNKKHSRFQTVDNELSKYFFTKYKFRIDIQSVILVV